MIQGNIIPLPALRDNYIWSFPTRRGCAIVDPGDAEPVLNQNIPVSHILITHHHADHTAGVKKLVKIYNPKVYWPADLKTGDSIPELALKVLEIPGHTQDHVAYYNRDILFCGDTLFAAGCGRAFEAEPAVLFHSLELLAALNPSTKIYCAHEYTEQNLRFAKYIEPDNAHIQARLDNLSIPSLPSELSLELKTNPFLRCHSETIKHSAQARCGHALHSPAEVFEVIRAWKDVF